MKSKLILPLAILAATAPLHALPSLTNEHVDVDIAFELGDFALGLHDETNDIEYGADEAILQVNPQAYELIPNNPLYSFLGTIGVDHVWRLPKVQDPNLLLLGTGTVEIDPGILTGNQLTLSLVSVVNANSGKFTLYDVDGFNNPIVYMNSGDGITGGDSIVLPVGNHADFNWTFSKEGLYEITLQASGFVGANPVSEQATYTFNVVPEPGSLGLLCLGALGFLGRRRRRTAGV